MNEFITRVYWNNPVSAWLTALAIVIIAGIAVKLIGNLVLKKLKIATTNTTTTFDDFLIDITEKAIIPLAYIGSIYFATTLLVLPQFVVKVVHAAWLICLTYYILKVISASFKKFIYGFLRKQENSEGKERQAGGLIVIINVVIWIVGIVFLIDNLGYNVTTLIAGLGIGGIAIALAAQAILGDLFSYFVIFFDRPFEIGDFVVVDDKAGVIENIGIKTTRLKTLGGEQLICSNTDLTNARLHNYKRLQSRRVNFKLGVTYQTTKGNLRQIPEIVKSIISRNDNVKFDRGHFAAYADSSLDFDFVYYVEVPDYNIYMDIHQSILYDIFDAFEDNGIEFAYPTRTISVQPELLSAITREADWRSKNN